MPQITRTVRIGSSHGLHARPAKLFAQAAKESGIPVSLIKDAGAPVNAAEPAPDAERTPTEDAEAFVIAIAPTSTVATPIVPCPHIGRQPLTSM